MSYALETKKRKFERILESLTDSSVSRTQNSLNTRNNVRNASNVSSYSTDSSKRRRITPTNKISDPVQASTASLTTHYLPSSRLAFLERLESFRQVTKWHIPSTSAANAVEWAKRGWICQDTDTVSCPSCKERLHVNIELEELNLDHVDDNQNNSQTMENDDHFSMANAVLQDLTKRYQEMIITAHTGGCSWRRRGCDSSIQRIEGLLNAPTALAGLEQRYQSIMEGDAEIPQVVPLPSQDSCDTNETELEELHLLGQQTTGNIDSLKLAICGWQRKEKDIIECRHCFRSLGLWLYRGAHPTVEHLDPVDSHLEYCPWRSGIAQDTQLTTANGRLQKFPGWTLVYLAIVKKNHKGRTQSPRDTRLRQEDLDGEAMLPQSTPEQREKKMKDLVKRIRDLKKPFNVKSLLRRKNK